MIPSSTTLTTGLCLAVAGMVGVTSTVSAQDNWPERPLNFVVGFGVGGSADRTARALSQFMPEELGQPISVVNREGAGGQLAATFVLAQPDDGYTVLATALSPYLANSIINTGADYELDDFAFINGQWSDWDIIAANAEVGISSVAEMIEMIRENPGQHSVSVVPGSAGHLTTYILLDAAGLSDSDLNVVTYESGGAARTAVAGGQVDFTILGGEGSEGIREMITPLAVVRDTPAPNWDAPPVNEALADIGLEIPVLSGSIRGIAVSAEFRDQHPDRFETLVDAYRRTLENPEFIAYLEENSIGADWLGPEATTDAVMTTYEVLQEYGHLLD